MEVKNDNNANLTLEQKFAKILLYLRRIRPFYSAIYEVMTKTEASYVPTAGVTTNEFLYNKDFINDTVFSELVFIMLHEVGHIGLKHVARIENRDPQLWNVACDLYVNGVLADEFGLTPGKTVDINGIQITMPAGSLYCSSLDINEEYVEAIYEAFESQAMKNGYKGNKSGRYSNGSSQNKNAGGQAGQNGQELNDEEFGYEFTYQGTKESSGLYNNGSKYNKFKCMIKPNSKGDLINNGDDQSVAQQKAEKIVTDALVRVEMSSTSYGDEGGGLMGIVKKMLKSELDWRKLLRKYLIAATSSDSSFSRPDKRMYYQKSIYPGQIQNEENSIKGVKVCIDTSGSISDQDIEYFCGQVYDLTRKFKIEAELIYWDTSVESTGEFTGYREFERIDLVGRGGTDPSVIFNYLDSKKCKVKPIVTLVFTDAYFSTEKITSKQRKKYKDTIWIMTRNHDKGFTPPFGKKAIAKFS